MSFADLPFDPSIFGHEVERSEISHTRKIGFLIYPDFEILDLCGPLDAFSYADRILRATGRERERGYELSVIAAEKGVVRSKCGIEIAASHSFADFPEGLDTLVVAGGEGAIAASRDDELVDWIRAMSARVRRLASICTGAFLLARGGLLNHRKVTTHWRYSADLAEAYPLLCVDPNLIFVRDGGVYTSGGVTAGIDLALALIEEDLGREVPRMVAGAMLVFLRRPGGQLQFSPVLLGETAGCQDISELKSWILGNAGEKLTVERLAEKVAMSPRNFARRFLAETQMTPARFVEYARVEAARCRLEQSDLSLQTIAAHCGFGNVERMVRAFKRNLNVGPHEYRDRFQSTISPTEGSRENSLSDDRA